MDKNTFGNSEQFKSLVGLTDIISRLPENKKARISSFIEEYNSVCKHIESIPDQRFKNYVIKTVKVDYRTRVQDMWLKYEPILLTHLQNFIKAKLNSLVPQRGIVISHK